MKKNSYYSYIIENMENEIKSDVNESNEEKNNDYRIDEKENLVMKR